MKEEQGNDTITNTYQHGLCKQLKKKVFRSIKYGHLLGDSSR